MYEGRQIKVEKGNQKMKTEINMKKNFNIISILNVGKKLVIFSELLILFFVIGSSIAIADTEPSEINTASEIQSNALNQTDSLPELKYAPENPKFTRYLNNKNYTQSAPSQSEYQTGFVPTPVDLSHLSDVSAGHVSAPAYYDLRTLNRVTDVRDQGHEGTCWAFATYASLESYLLPEENRDFSENNMKNLLSSAYPEGFDYTPDEGGNHLMSTAYLARWSGPVDEADDPYDPSNYSSVYSPTGLRVQKHIRDVLIIPDRKSPMDNDNIKSAVQNYGAVYTTMYVDPAYYSPDQRYYYFNNDISYPNHAVAIVGWNDSFDKNQFSNVPPGNGAFIVKNSWGKTWGEDGYFYVSYYDTKLGYDGNVVFTAENTDNYDSIYQYDPLGWVNSVGYSNPTCWCANVFTAKSYEVLKAVGFYTTDSNCNYEIYIHTDPEFSPISRTGYVLAQSGTIPFAGYHTIPLNSGVKLKAGQKFSVVLKLTTPGYNFPIAFEYPRSGYSSKARANTGESFISPNGIKWEDLTAHYPNANVCVKAFTYPISFPVANFSSNVSEGYVPLNVQFNDSSRNATGWYWDFGDGNYSTEQNPVHVYSRIGTYPVNLTASNDNGTDSKLATIAVLKQPAYAYIANMGSNTISVIDTAKDIVITTVEAGAGPYGVGVSPDGKKVYVANNDSNTVSAIDTATNTVTATIPVGRKPWGIAVAPDGTKVHVANNLDNTTSVIDTATNTVITTVPAGIYPSGVAVTPDGTKVYFASSHHSENSTGSIVSVIDTATNGVIASVPVGNVSTGISVTPDGTKVYVSNSLDDTVSVIDTATNTIIATVPVGDNPQGNAVSPEGKMVYVANYDSNTISIIDAVTDTLIASVPVEVNPIGVSFNPDENEAYVTNSGSNTVSVIDTATHRVKTTMSVGEFPAAFGQFIKQPVLPFANFNSNVSEGYAPLSVQFTDLSKNAMEWSWNFGDGNYSTEQNPVHIFSAPQIHIVNLTVSNEKGTASKLATITVTQQSSPSGGGDGSTDGSSGGSGSSKSGSSGGKRGGSRGGGGGGGGSPEPARNVDVKELSQVRVVSGNSVKFDFPKNATCVVYVSFDAKKTAGKTTTIVEQLKAKSTLTSNLSSGEVYKYFNLWVGNAGFATEKNIENPVVCFKVEKSWLEDKNIDQNSITLNRYSDKKWSELPIKLLREDSKYLYFTADTPGFTYFAITGNTIEKESENETELATDIQDPGQESIALGSKDKLESKDRLTSETGKITSIPGFRAVCGVVSLLAISFCKRRFNN